MAKKRHIGCGTYFRNSKVWEAAKLRTSMAFQVWKKQLPTSNIRYLKNILIEISEVLLEIKDKTAIEIFGSPDDLKLRASMTLFSKVVAGDSIFTKVLDQYFEGKCDFYTVELLGENTAVK